MSKSLTPSSTPAQANTLPETAAVPDNPYDAARQAPELDEHWDAVDELAREEDRPDATEALYAEVLETALDSETLNLVGQRAIEFLEEWYEDTERSILILQKVLHRNFDNAWALEKLSLLLTLAERWDDLLGTYDAALANQQPTASRISLLEEAARIAKDFAGQAQRASAYLKQLLLLKPEDEKLALSLERRLEQQGRYQDMVDIWSARLSVLTPTEELIVRVRIGRTQLESLHQAEAALTSAKDLLGAGIGETEACDLLESITRSEHASLETQREALDLLRQRYAKLERPDDVIQALRRALDLAEDDDARVLTNQRLVTWLLQAGELRGALQACARWLRLSPGAQDALEQLRALSSSTGQYADFAAALVHAAEAAPTAKLRVNLVLEAAETEQEQSKNEASASELFSRVLLDPDAGAEGKLRAARKLTGLLTATQQGGQRLDVLEKRAALEPETEDRVALLAQAAELAEALGDDERALRLWDGRLALEPQDKKSLDAKILVLTRVGRFDELRATLLLRVESTTDKVQQRKDLVRVAELDENELAQPQAAILSWQRVESVFGADTETVDALVHLLGSESRWDELIALLQRAIKAEDDAARKTVHLAELGRIFAVERGDLASAVDAYRAALKVDATFTPARDGLTLLLDDDTTRHAAAETLAEAYKDADEWESLLALSETRLNAEPSPAARQAILLEAADLLEQRASDQTEALLRVERAFSIHPQAQIEQRMIALAHGTGSWDTVVSGYQRALRHCDELTRTTELLFEQGKTLEVHLKNHDEALTCYVRIVELEPGHLAAACSVIRCAAALGAWSSPAWALLRSAASRAEVDATLSDQFETSATQHDAWDEALAAAAEAITRSTRPDDANGLERLSPETSHQLKFLLARWHRDRRRDPLAAEKVLSEAVAEHRAIESLEMLCELRRRAPGRPLVETLLSLADVGETPLETLNEAARVAHEVVGDPTLARPIISRTLNLVDEALQLERTAELESIASWCVETLVGLYNDAQEPETAFALLERAATMSLEPTLLLAFKHQGALLAATTLGETETAARLCRQIIERAPARGETISLLASLYESKNQLPDLLDLKLHELKLKPALPRRLALRQEIARVLGSLNKPHTQQLEQLDLNLEESPGHAETLTAMAELYTSLGQHKTLYELYCEQAATLRRLESAPAAATLYARAGRLAEDNLGQPESALEAYELATQLQPDVDVLDRLADINAEREAFGEAVTWLDQRLQLTSPDAGLARRAALVRLGTALSHAGNTERAIAELHAGLVADAEARQVRELLATLHESREEWAELADVLSQGVDYTPDPETRTAYLTRAAEIRWHKLNDVAGATPLLEEALALNTADRDLRLELAEALRLEQRFEESKGLLDGLLADFGRRRTPERAVVHFQLAQIARATHELDEALSQLDAASKIQRSDPLILKTLGDVARENGELERAERAYRALLLLVSRGDKTGESNSDIGASSILFELYRIATERGDVERAKDLLDSAIEAADEDPVEARRLEKALALAGKWDLMIESLERRARLTDDPDELFDIARGRAQALKELGRFDAAYTLCAALLPEHAGNEGLFTQSEELAQLSSNTDVFEQLIIRTAEDESTTPDLSCRLWLRLGRAAEAAEKATQASDYYRRAQLTGQKPKASFEALARVLELSGDSAGLIQALQELLRSAERALSKKDIKESLFRLAALELSSGNLVDEGVAHLKQALALESDAPRAFAILAAAKEHSRQSEEAARLLEQVAAQTGDETHWVLALRQLCETPFARLELLEGGADSARRQGRLDDETALLEAAVRLSQRPKESAPALWAFDRLCSLREAEGEYGAAEALLQLAVDASKDEQQVRFRLRLAELQRSALDAPRLAAATYEAIASDDPADARAWKPLVALYRELGAEAQLEASLSRAEKHVDDPEEKVALRLERVRLMLDAGRTDEAEAALRQMLSTAPDNAQVSELLVQLLDRQDRPDAIKRLLSERLEYATTSGNDALTVSYALQLGTLLEDENDTGGAIDIYRSARVSVTNNRPLLNALLRLVPEGEDHERADLLESLLPTETTEAVEQVAVRLAGLRSTLGDETGLERALELGFKLNPYSQELKGRLQQWYEDREDWLPLAELMTIEAATIEDTASALVRFQEAALLYEEKLGDAVSAAAVLRQALSRAPTSPQVLELYAQYQLTAGGGDLAIEAITEAFRHEQLDESTRALLHHLRAAVRARSDEHSLDAVEKAVADLDAAAALGGEELDDDLSALLLRQRELAEGAGNRGSERRVIARLSRFLPARGQADEARELLGHWVRRNPDDRDMAEQWATLSMELCHWLDAVDAYGLLFSLETGDARRVTAIHFAEACEHAGVPLTAREVLEKARKEFPTDEELGERVFRMYDASGAQVEFAQLLLEEAKSAESEQHRFTLLTNAGALLLRTETPHELGIHAYAQALELRPDDHGTRVGLANSYTRFGQIADACALLEDAIKEHGKRRSPQLSELQHAMANVAEAAGDEDGRFAWLDAALQSDRRNGVVATELAVFAMEKGEYDAAIKALQLVALLKSDSPMSRAEAYLRQGIIAQERGDKKKALLLGKRALNSDPAYEPAVQFLDQLARA